MPVEITVDLAAGAGVVVVVESLGFALPGGHVVAPPMLAGGELVVASPGLAVPPGAREQRVRPEIGAQET